MKISVCDGNWTNPGTWNTGQIPFTSDTVLIYNDVVLDTDVIIVNPGLIYVEENYHYVVITR